MSVVEAVRGRRIPRPRANPVLRRELVSRWRGRRAFLLLTLYLGLIAAVVVLLYLVGAENAQREARFDLVDPGPEVGRFLFDNLLGLVLLLVLFIGPGYAASQVVGERERQTLGLLQVTLIRPRSFVLGKLVASIAWLLLLVVATLPFAAATFFLGGVAPGDLVRGLVYVLGVAVSVAAMAIGISAVVRSTTAAVVTTYGLVLALTLGTLFTALVEYTLLDTVDQFDRRSAWTMYANPYLGLTDAVRAQQDFDATPSVLEPFVSALPAQNRQQRGDMGFAFEVAEPAIGGVFMGDAVDMGLVEELAAEGRVDPEQVMAALEQGVDPEVLHDVVLGGVSIDEAVASGMLPEGVLAADGIDALGGPPSRSPVWLQVLGLYLALGALGLVVATRRVAVPRTRRRPPSEDRNPPPPPDVTPGADGLAVAAAEAAPDPSTTDA